LPIFTVLKAILCLGKSDANKVYKFLQEIDAELLAPAQ
jgi:hypothetical protein